MSFRALVLSPLLALLCALPVAAQTNLLANGGFEVDADGDGLPDAWDQERQNNTQGTFARDTDQHTEGDASLRIEHPEATNAWVRSSQDGVAARPRTIYRLDVAVKATGPYLVLLYEFTPEVEQGYVTHNIGSGRGTDGEWRSLGQTLTTGEQATTFKLSLITQGQGTAWFDDARLVRVGAMPDAEAVATDQPPVIDGRLDDAVWSEAPRSGPFYTLGTLGERPAAATYVQTAWTPTHLYVAYTAEEPRPGEVKRAVDVYDGPVYTDDAVELFLDPERGAGGYAQLAVNAAGTRFDSRKLGTRYNATWYDTGGATQIDWDPEWQAAAAVGDGAWTVEIALPFAALGEAPQIGDTWGANFTRQRQVEPELSTWAPLQGDTFLVPPAQYGRLIFRGVPDRAPEMVTRTAGEMPARHPVVPQPQELTWGEGQVALPAPLRLRPTSAAAATYLPAVAELWGAEALPVGEPLADAVNLSIGEGMQPEGYRLVVAAGAAPTLTGADPLGVRNGLMTLGQLAFVDAGQTWLPAITVNDWPDTPLRAWHAHSPLAHQGDAYRNWVQTLAKLKYDTLMLEVNDHFAYESHPEIADPEAPTKAQLREWVDYAKALGFEVIPQVQVYGHFNWVLHKPGWGDLSEHAERDERRGLWNANIRDPRYYPLVYDLYQEVIAVFEPEIFHIGHDEITFRPIGVHADTQDTPPHELFAEEVNRLHGWLTARGLRVMMWGDQLLEEQHGGAPYNTYLATDLVPKDIIIADWHYPPREEYPSVDYLEQHGFPVVACGWWDPLNLYHFSNKAVDTDILGFSGTSWWAIDNFANAAELQSGFVIGAENSWTNRRPTLEEMEYEPMSVWRQLAGWSAIPPAETRYATIDLSRHANQTLSDSGRGSGWLGLGSKHDFAMLPRGTQWWGGVPYRILDGPREAVVLAATDDDAGSAPTAIYAIPVGTRADALYFAHVTSAPAQRYGNIYDRGRYLPQRIGQYVVHYADGSQEIVPIRYRTNITDWNAGLPPAWAPTAWTGRTAGGARAQLPAWRWDNPHPDKPIASIDVIGMESPLQIAVVAITAAVE